MSYRDDARFAARESNWTFWKLLPLFIVATIILGGVGFAVNSAGLFGRTVVERKVFENSYQRSEAIKAQIATDEAALVEIEAKLRNPNLDENMRINLEAQASAIRVRLNAAKEKLK